MFCHLRATLAALTLAIVCAASAGAQVLQNPKGEVILTVTGAIKATNGDGVATFDLAMLEALDDTVIETETVWTEGVKRFQGVSLHEFVKHLGITGGILRASAINDYVVEIPASDAVEGGAIIAYHIDGAPMSVREKGPLWVIYPYDESAEYRSEVIYNRSIWQLDRIEAVN